MTPQCVWPLGATLGEGPIWWQDALWFVDIKGLAIHRFRPDTGETRSWPAPAQPGFLAPAESGGFIVGLKTGLHRFDPDSGAFTLLFEVEPHRPGNRLNDGAVDPNGVLWFGSMDDGETEATGRLYRLDPTGPRDVGQPCVITNGPAFSADGSVVFRTDTLRRMVMAADVLPDGALAEEQTVFIHVEEGGGYPDGSVMDAEGCLWIGLFDGWSLRRYSPAGELIRTVRFPCANITKMAFGGPDLTTAYVTTAAKGLTARALAKQPLAGGLFAFETDVAGLPQQAVRGF